LIRVYEVLFIVAPNTEEGDVESLITQLSDVVTNQGAQVAKVDRMGRRRLAYPIQKFSDGYYVVLTVEGTGAEIAEVERRMRVSDAIIRYITIRIDEDLKRAEKFRARRAAGQAAAAASGRRSRNRRAPAVAVVPDEDEDGDEEGEE
jgi:small subunit ribosomal protein S6